MTHFSPQYIGYIASSAWRVRRQRAIERAGGKCQVCGDRRFLQVHHNDYGRLGHEADEDLTVLCWYCHAVATWAIRLRRWWRRKSAGGRVFAVFSITVGLPMLLYYWAAWLFSL
jgi:5-methylcytosine-specific restriction endonuclease McrA